MAKRRQKAPIAAPSPDPLTDPVPDPVTSTGTQIEVVQAQRSHSAPSWSRLSGKISFHLRAHFGRVNLPPLVDFDDFVSEVMVVVLRDIKSFEDRGKGSFWAWVQRLGHNRLNDLWRHHTAQIRGGGKAGTAGGTDTDVLESVPDHGDQGTGEREVREIERVEFECVSQLSEDMQNVYLLRRREERSFRDIMQAIGRNNEVTVRSLYKRARDYVRRCIEAKMDRLNVTVS